MDTSSAVERIVKVLRESIRVCRDDLLNMIGISGRDGELAIWEAVQIVRRADNIVFAKLDGFPRHIHRIDGKQLVEHAGRQRRAGGRKIDRSMDKLRVAFDTAKDEATKELASRAEARAKMAIVRRRVEP